jgi:SAM-dependent methyltransferase
LSASPSELRSAPSFNCVGANAAKRPGVGQVGRRNRLLDLACCQARTAAKRLVRAFFHDSYGAFTRRVCRQANLRRRLRPVWKFEWASMASERIGLDPLVGRYRRFGIDQHKMRYVESCAENMPFPDSHFDIVSSFNALDHVDNPRKALAEISRVIKKNGLFLLLVEVNHEPRL